MKTITTTVTITYTFPEFDPDGDPISDQDEGMPALTKIVQDGKDITEKREDSGVMSPSFFWDLLPQEINSFGLIVELYF